MCQGRIRPISADDEPMLSAWWTAHGKPIIPAHLWPKHGFLVNDLAAGFLIGTDAGFALAEWYVTRPGCAKIERREALRLLTQALSEKARQLGYAAIIALANKDSLVALLKEEGFDDDASGLISLMRRL